MMPGNALVEGEGRQKPFGPLGGAAKIDVIDIWTRAVDGSGVVVAARLARLDGDRHPLQLELRFWKRAEIGGQFRFEGVKLAAQLAEELGFSGIRIRIEEPRILTEHCESFG